MVGRAGRPAARADSDRRPALAAWVAQRRVAPAVGVALVCLAVYLATMGRTVGEADAFEFQVVAPTLGIAHPTGYPLMILLGKLFSLLPVGTVAWRVNLVSAAAATAAVTLLYVAVMRLSGRRTTGATTAGAPAAAAAGALALAFSPVFWAQATQAEVYALNAAFVAAILALLVHGLPARAAGEPPVGRRWLYTLAVLYGLALTHHLTAVLLAPALVMGVWRVRPAVRPRHWIIAAALGAATFAVELYLPLRWPALHNGAALSPAEWLAWITGQRFGGAVQFDLWRDATRWRIIGGVLWGAFGPAGAALAAAGLAWLAVRRGALAAVTLTAFAAYCVYGVIYNVADVSVFVLPAHLVMAFWIGAALSAAAAWLPHTPPSFSGQGAGHAAWRRGSGRAAFLIACALLPVGLLLTNAAAADRSADGWDRYHWGRYVLGLPLPPGAVILADSEKIAPLYYLTTVEKVRPDVQAMVLGDEAGYRAELDRRLAAGEPVYLARYLPGLAGQYRLNAVGPLVQVEAKGAAGGAPPAAPPMQQRLDGATWDGGRIALLGYDAARGQDDTAWRVTLYWSVRSQPAAAYQVRLRWVGASGQAWWADSGAQPVAGLNPMTAWRPGEVVADYHEIPADAAIPPGDWRLEVGLFLPFSDDGPAPDRGDGPWQPVTTLAQPSLPATPGGLFSPTRRTYGGELWIAGGVADLGVLPPGETTEARLTWGRTAPGPARTLRLRWVQGGQTFGQPVAAAPYAGEYPTTAWPVGRTLVGKAALPAPAQTGAYTLYVGWLDAAGRPLPARCGWLAPLREDCPVAALRVEGAARGQGVNFAHQALLTAARLGQTTRRAGEKLDVTLQWQGLRRWDADYTAFVHLIGPDGKLHGQVDQWPVDGTLPTTAWTPGRIVDDPYHVQLAYDAPPGAYQVEVGWYLLATSRRLPVLDASGRPVDDRVIIGAITVEP